MITKSVIMFHEISTNTMEAPACNIHAIFITTCCNFQGGTPFVDFLWFFSVLCLIHVCLCARLFICALWSLAGKGLTSWLSFMVSYCEFVNFPLVSWVRCGT